MKEYVKEKNYNKITEFCENKNFTLLEDYEYKGAHRTILHLQCNHCGNKSYRLAASLFNYHGCSKCGREYKLSKLEVLNLIKEECKKRNCTLQNINFIYIGGNTELNLKCNDCGVESNVYLQDFINSSNKRKCKHCDYESLALVDINKVKSNLKRYIKNKNFILLQPFKYQGNRTKNIHLKCNMCNYEWFSYYQAITANSGCANCNGNAKLREEDVKKDLPLLLSKFNYTLIEEIDEYDGGNTELKLKCNVCNYEWKTRFALLRKIKTGCPLCNQHVVDKKVCEQNVVEKCNKNEYILLDKFIFKTNHTKNIHLKCNKCLKEWYVSYSNFIGWDSGCMTCAKGNREYRKRLTNKEFIDRANVVHNYKFSYEKVDYKGMTKKVIINCPIHGDFEQLAVSHLQGCGCNKCRIEKFKKDE